MKNKKNLIFNLLFWGKINPQKISIKKVSGLLKRSKASEKFITKEWQKRVASGLKTWPSDTLPSRHHFDNLKISAGSLEIYADPAISYRDIIGSRSEKFKKLFKGGYRPIPLTATMVVLAKNKIGNKFLAITLRNSNNDLGVGGFHVTTGGAIEIKKDKKPIDAALRETKEEMGIKKNELSSVVCQAISLNPWLPEIGIIFTSILNIPLEKLRFRQHDDENDILFISADKNNLEYWLTEFNLANSIDGIIGVLAIGENLYGKKWAENILSKILKNNKRYENYQERTKLEKAGIRKLKKWLDKNTAA